MKWISARTGILKGQKPKNGDKSKLQAVDNTMKQVSTLRSTQAPFFYIIHISMCPSKSGTVVVGNPINDIDPGT